MNEFTRFIKLAGGPEQARQILGVSQGLISLVKHGKRGLNKKHCRTIVEHYPELSMIRLLFPEAYNE